MKISFLGTQVDCSVPGYNASLLICRKKRHEEVGAKEGQHTREKDEALSTILLLLVPCPYIAHC